MRTTGLLFALLLLACGDGSGPDGDETPRSFAVDPPPGLSGTVVDDAGNPVAGAEVKIRIPLMAGYRGWKDGLAAVTGADGTFHLDVDGELAPSRETEILIAVKKKGIVPSLVRLPSYQPGRAKRVEVTVTRAGRVVGRVVDANGDPVAGAQVYALEDGQDSAGSEAETSLTRSNGDGTFEIDDLEPGFWQIGARADGTLPTVVGGVEVTLQAPAKVPDLSLRPGETLRGRAVTTEGEPAPGCRITAYRDPALKTALFFGETSIKSSGGTAMTDSDGRFEITGLAPAEHGLAVVAIGHSLPGAEPTGIRPGGDEVRLTLEPGAEMVIRVADPKTRKDLPYFVASITFSDFGEHGKAFTELVEAVDGVVRILVLMNRAFRMEVSAPGYGVGTRDFTLPDPGPHEYRFGLFPR